MRSPFTEAELADVLEPFGSSRTLPGAAYTSADVFAWEQHEFFTGSWVCVGRSRELVPQPGAQRAVTVGNTTVLLTRDTEGGLHALANVCRHRGHELLVPGESAQRAAVVCPYHGWSYRLDGHLQAAPRFHDQPAFDASQFGLQAVAMEDWHGWVFVNATAEAPPLRDHLGDLDGVLAPYECSRLVTAAATEYTVAANWKLIHENYHECYHCPKIHPELCKVTPPGSGHNYAPRGAWVGGTMQLRAHAETMSLDGHSGGAPIATLVDEQLRTVAYVGAFPNLLISLHPDYVLTHRLQPIDVRTTRISCEWLFPASVVDRPDFDPEYAVRFWDITNQQDWLACESVQRGIESPHYRPGPLAPGEDAVYQFEALVASRYLGR